MLNNIFKVLTWLKKTLPLHFKQVSYRKKNTWQVFWCVSFYASVLFFLLLCFSATNWRGQQNQPTNLLAFSPDDVADEVWAPVTSCVPDECWSSGPPTSRVPFSALPSAAVVLLDNAVPVLVVEVLLLILVESPLPPSFDEDEIWPDSKSPAVDDEFFCCCGSIRVRPRLGGCSSARIEGKIT